MTTNGFEQYLKENSLMDYLVSTMLPLGKKPIVIVNI